MAEDGLVLVQTLAISSMHGWPPGPEEWFFLLLLCHGLHRHKHRPVGTGHSRGHCYPILLNSVLCQILFLIQNITICAKLLYINALHLLTHLHQHAIALTEQNLLIFNLYLVLYSPLLWFSSSYRSLSQGSTNSNMLDVQGGAHKKRARRSSLLNAKKLYEDAQMARKVKQYLSSLDVETDEEKFQMMSLQWEPAYGTCEYEFSFMWH